MKRKVWILNHYAGNMYFEKGGRHYWFAKYLIQKGYSPVIFVANTKHNAAEQWIDTNELWVEKKDDELDIPFVFVKSNCYSGNNFSRIRNMFGFYRNVKRAVIEYSKNKGKPDIILASSVHPLTLVAGLQLANKFGVKCICEVRDLWPEAIVAYSNHINKNSLIARLMYLGEKWIYKKASAVIFTQEGGPDYVCNQGWDKMHGGPIDNAKLFHINNGVDLESFDDNLNKYPFHDVDLDNPDIFKVVYCGSIRRINNLGLIVDVAKCINDSHIKLIIFGDGDELETLKERVRNEKIDNIVFKGRVKKQYIPSIDSKADLNLVHWEMNPMLKVGESYNKSFEYFAAKRPVFYTIRPGYSIVERYHCGRITNGFSSHEIADGIQKMAEMSPSELEQLSNNARKTAEIYDFKKLTDKLIDVIELV